MSGITHFRIDSPNVVYETFENEIVVVHFESGNYYSLEKSAADIWSSIARGMTLAEIAQALNRLYREVPPDIEEQVGQFVAELRQESLVTADGQDAPVDMGKGEKLPDSPVPSEQSAYESPVLQRYTDMQDMLLLDPIHEVDESGWPAARPGHTDRNE